MFNDMNDINVFDLMREMGVLKAEKEELQRQLAEVAKERDQLRALLTLADALRNKERGIDK